MLQALLLLLEYYTLYNFYMKNQIDIRRFLFIPFLFLAFGTADAHGFISSDIDVHRMVLHAELYYN